MAGLKAALKKVIPDFVLEPWRQYRVGAVRRELQKCATAADTFSKVYDRGYWGQSGEPGDAYYSGPGSHGSRAVETYLSAVSEFLSGFGEKLNAVDLGCGDFAIGSRIRPLCGNYIAADVVTGLIERNRNKFKDSEVDFRVLDIINDELPKGDVVFIRQVLQHLSNVDIEKIVAKLPGHFRFLILTEELPMSSSFVPNLDKMRGPEVRLTAGAVQSGVVLTEPPFNLKVAKTTVLCEAPGESPGPKGVIRTNLYEF